MGSFGDGVGSLLDTYTKCLALLKRLMGGSKATRDQARLGTSIRNSRSKVRKFYSSQVSERGSTFEKGDATARSSLRRLVRRLKAFLDGLMGSFNLSQRPDFDYGSLMTLSTGSGQEAIRTMTDLSHRVSASTTSFYENVQGQGHKRPSHQKPNRGDGSSMRSRSSSSRNTLKSRRSQEAKARDARGGPSRTGPEQAQKRRPTFDHQHIRQTSRASSRHDLHQSRDGLEQRLSMLTTSSDSTKLGEIRHVEHKKPAIATYPLRAHRREAVSQKKGKWFDLLR